MKIKTNELTGAALDWAVHIALHGACEGYAEHEYTTDWAQGGPIIEREEIELTHAEQFETRKVWLASAKQKGLPKGMKGYYQMLGETPLVAAMRCYVASKLGDEVEIPEELI